MKIKKKLQKIENKYLIPSSLIGLLGASAVADYIDDLPLSPILKASYIVITFCLATEALEKVALRLDSEYQSVSKIYNDLDDKLIY